MYIFKNSDTDDSACRIYVPHVSVKTKIPTTVHLVCVYPLSLCKNSDNDDSACSICVPHVSVKTKTPTTVHLVCVYPMSLCKPQTLTTVPVVYVYSMYICKSSDTDDSASSICLPKVFLQKTPTLTTVRKLSELQVIYVIVCNMDISAL